MARVKNDTTLVATGGGSNSLRSTVPIWIIEQFDLRPGDRLAWKLDIENGEFCIKVNPVKEV